MQIETMPGSQDPAPPPPLSPLYRLMISCCLLCMTVPKLLKLEYVLLASEQQGICVVVKQGRQLGGRGGTSKSSYLDN